MYDLNSARENISEIDRQIAKLFEERMRQAETVAAYKKENGFPIFDSERESFLINRNSAFVSEDLKPYYKEFLTDLMDVSKKYQQKLISGMTVAFSGVEGAFAHIAALKIFGKNITALPCSGFGHAYTAVENGSADCAVLPIENSYAGDVDRVLDLAYKGDLSVNGIYDMPLSQCLIAKKGVLFSDIKEVISHPQALSQCAPYLKKQGWKITESVNTAVAAKTVAESDRTDIAVIGAREAADIYGLSVLEGEINENGANTTRFAVFSREKCKISQSDKHFIMFFTAKNEPGALSKAISIISKYGINLRCLKSHPTGDENWTYYFYAEGDGNLGEQNGKEMIARLKDICDNVKISGSFSKEKMLSKQR